MVIRYIKHEQIDFKKWDKCIKKSINGSLYAYSWFLNEVSPGWDALIDESYETVMPLTQYKIFGTEVLLQPYFATNLGVYSSRVLDSETVNLFIIAVPRKFKYIKINLNKYNKFTINDAIIRYDIHYELDLIRAYKMIRESYTKDIKNRLIIGRQRVNIISGLNSNDLVMLYRRRKGVIWGFLHRTRINTLKTIISTAVRYRVGEVYGAYINNTLCGAAFFIFSHEKATLLFLSLNKISIKEYALEVIIDEFIKLHAEQNLTLRFEFATRKKFGPIYTGFGGRRNKFVNILQNKLPGFFKYLKL